MAKMFITIKIMPDSPDTDFKKIRNEVKVLANNLDIELLDKDILEPVAFGLKALKLMFLLDESKGSEDIANEISSIEGVSSAEVIDMRRAIG